MDAKAALAHARSSERGLKENEVDKRRAQHGWNELPAKSPAGWWTFLFAQFVSPLIVILGIAAIISAALADWINTGVIVVAMALNVVVGFFQEFKANRALEKLRSYVQPTAVVRRDGYERSAMAREVVVGDVLVLSAGDRVAADARILDVADCEVNEAALTGESMPVFKSSGILPTGTPLAERTNMVYAGTVVSAGRCIGIVVAIGTQTEFGKIAGLVESTEESPTPLQTELRRLAIWISGVVVSLVVVLFVAGVFAGRGVVEMFETSVALAVAAIPEGLTVSITIILAIGMQRILRRGSLTRRLVAAETLGSVSVICTDKTGTITEGTMRVSAIALERGIVDVAMLEKASAAEDVIRILEAVMLCNDAAVSSGDGLVRTEVFGSATEKALMEVGLQAGISYRELTKTHPRLGEIPFDSSRKYMVTAHEWGQAGSVAIVKGAPEKVIGFCGMEQKKSAEMQRLVERMTERGLRVIAVGWKKESGRKSELDSENLNGFDLLGFIGLSDPLRPEVKEHILAAKMAGVRTVLVTGDHPKTAMVIAREAGITDGRDGVVSGSELDAWDDVELAKRVAGIRVFARVEPRHKIRIVRAWQSRNEVVAMTGDGVNDAPALKAADIGVALGSGTDVAKEVSDLVLLDNNIGTITAAIEQGRVMFDNMRKSVAYLLTDSFTEIVLIGGAIVLGLPLPLLPVQILWINLVADTFPNLALTMEPAEPDVMKIPPRPRGEAVVNRPMASVIFLIGVVTDLALFGMYLWFSRTAADPAFTQSVMFVAVGIDSLLYVFALKSFRLSIFRINPFSNPALIGGVAIGFLLIASAFVVPSMRAVFGLTLIPLSAWGFLLMMGVLKLTAVEIGKEAVLKRYL